jgi:hypothetical protein
MKRLGIAGVSADLEPDSGGPDRNDLNGPTRRGSERFWRGLARRFLRQKSSASDLRRIDFPARDRPISDRSFAAIWR